MHTEHFIQLTWRGLDWGVFIFSGERGLARLHSIWLGTTAEFSVTTWSSSKLKISSQSSVFLLTSLPADGTITFFLNLFSFSGSPRPNAIPVNKNTTFKGVLLLDYFPYFIIFFYNSWKNWLQFIILNIRNHATRKIPCYTNMADMLTRDKSRSVRWRDFLNENCFIQQFIHTLWNNAGMNTHCYKAACMWQRNSSGN